MIRKPDVEVFRDSGTVVALRGAGELVKEGGRGVMTTFARLWMTGMLVVFIGTGLGAMARVKNSLGGLIGLALIGAAIWGLCRLWRAPTREDAIEDGATAVGAGISVPLPDHLRHADVEAGFHVDYWPRAFVNQSTLLFLGGFMLMRADPWGFGPLCWSGVLMVMRSVLLLSLFFGGRTCVTASRDGLSVHALLGDGTIWWGDITNVSLRTAGRREWWTMLSTGTRQHIVVCGYPRSGKGELLIPYKLLGLDSDAVTELMRRILCRAETARGRPPPTPGQPRIYGQAAPAAPARQGFDPDAVMARYLAQRDGAPATPNANHATSPAAGGGAFDADTVMARYLATRGGAPAYEAPPTLGSVPLPSPQLRSFGRKRA